MQYPYPGLQLTTVVARPALTRDSLLLSLGPAFALCSAIKTGNRNFDARPTIANKRGTAVDEWPPRPGGSSGVCSTALGLLSSTVLRKHIQVSGCRQADKTPRVLSRYSGRTAEPERWTRG